MDIVVIFFFDSLKNVLKRGFYQEFVMTVKQTCLITLCSVFYLFTFKEAENYSRLVLGYTAALYLLISYVLRCLWKNVPPQILLAEPESVLPPYRNRIRYR
ncbi:MAG: hypothetical protein ACLVIY_00030 [Anaerobutyricum soehngenii]